MTQWTGAPTDVAYLSKHRKQQRHKTGWRPDMAVNSGNTASNAPQTPKKVSRTPPIVSQTPQAWMLRLYDQEGNPVCGFCGQGHRSRKCLTPQAKAYWTKSPTVAAVSKGYVQSPDTSATTDSASDTFDPSVASVAVESIQRTTYSKAPRAHISIFGFAIHALLDTGADISCIKIDTVNALKATVNTQDIISYRDVNGMINNTLGRVSLPVFNKFINFYVLKTMQHPLILGWDGIQLLQGTISSVDNSVTFAVPHPVKLFLAQRAPAIASIDIDLSQVQEDHRIALQQLLNDHSEAFASNPKKPKITHLSEFAIDTGDHTPVFSPPRKYHPAKHDIIDKEINEMLRNGIIRPTLTPTWGSAAQIVSKSDGSNRLVVDYVQLNKLTKTIKFNPYGPTEILHALGEARIFSTLDLASGYWQIPVCEKDKSKTALTCRAGVFEFNVMPFGMKNAPAVFQNLMTMVLSDLSWKCATAYMDDIIVFSRSPQAHIQHLKLVFDRLIAANLSIGIKKCQWMTGEVKFLGFLATTAGIKPQPDKIQAIQVIPAPIDLKGISSFLGMVGQYQRFISGYSVKTEPLRLLRKKDEPFRWTEAQQQAFELLKEDLARLPTLRQPDFDKQFELHSDAASTKGIAVVLCQRDGNDAYPLYFASRSLTTPEKNYSVQELEALAIYWGIKKFRPYLEFGHFVVYTDHSSLRWLMNTTEEKQGRLARWKVLLQNFSFDIIYTPGKTNFTADTLSRHPLPTIRVISVSPTIDWIQEQRKDDFILQTMAKVTDKATTVFHIKQGILFRILPKPRARTSSNLALVIPSHLRQHILNAHHDAPMQGHLGALKTYQRLKNHFWWPACKVDVETYVKTCLTCQQVKGDKPALHIYRPTRGEGPFNRVAMDVFGPLPITTNGNRYILVLQDTFSKWIEMYPLAAANTDQIVERIHHQYITRHGTPKEWLSDNGPPFNSSFVNVLSMKLGIKHCFTPPYHPESNGIVERFMSTLRNMIVAFLTGNQWDKHLRFLRFAYNTSYHPTLKDTPFFLVHGRDASPR